MFSNLTAQHKYILCCTGTKFKDKVFGTRLDAEIAMYGYCAKHGIRIECSECNKHERKYTNHNGIRFYINRI